MRSTRNRGACARRFFQASEGGKAGQNNGSARGLRGGTWNNNENNLRASNRNSNDPANENNNIGFRVAKPLWG